MKYSTCLCETVQLIILLIIEEFKKIITLFQTFADGFNILDSSLDVDNVYPDGFLKIFVILKSIAKIENKVFFKILGFFS